MQSLFIIAIAAVINRIRGGLLGPVLPKGRGDDFAAFLFGVLVFFIYPALWALPAVAIAFRLGEAHGWGHWAGVAVQAKNERPIVEPRPITIFGIHLFTLSYESPIDYLLESVESVDKWAFYGLTLRGLLWGIILSIPLAFISLMASAAIILAGSMFGLCFFSTRLLPIDGNRRWAVAEYLQGACFGVALLTL